MLIDGEGVNGIGHEFVAIDNDAEGCISANRAERYRVLELFIVSSMDG